MTHLVRGDENRGSTAGCANAAATQETLLAVRTGRPEGARHFECTGSLAVHEDDGRAHGAENKNDAEQLHRLVGSQTDEFERTLGLFLFLGKRRANEYRRTIERTARAAIAIEEFVARHSKPAGTSGFQMPEKLNLKFFRVRFSSLIAGKELLLTGETDRKQDQQNSDKAHAHGNHRTRNFKENNSLTDHGLTFNLGKKWAKALSSFDLFGAFRASIMNNPRVSE